MGNFSSGGTSILSGSTVTRTDLLRATSNNRDFTNKIFNAMITKITPIEILSLSNPATCSKYVFLMGNSIEKIFEDLKIKPGRDSSGIIYYQRVDKIITKNPETRELCLLIAYFHIRLFQIFGALALTIIDDASAGAVLGVLHRDAEAGRYQYQLQQTRGKPSFWGGPVHRPGSKPVIFTGGAVDESELSSGLYRQFKPLANILSETNDDLGLANKFSGRKYYFDDNPNIYLIFSGSSPYIYYNNNDQEYFAKISLRPIISRGASPGFPAYGGPGYGFQPYGVPGVPPVNKNYTVELSNYIYHNKSEPSIDTPVQARLRSSSSKIYITAYDDNWYNLNDNSKKFTDSLETEFIKKISTIVKTITKAGPGDPGRPGVPGVPGGPGRMSDAFSNGPLITQYIIETIKNISKGGTASFCVARALQLLDAESSFQPRPTQIRSSVCKKPFTSLPSSVPQSKLVEVPSLRVLEQLYSVNPHVDPKTERINFQMDVQYISFLTRMQGIFNKTATGTPSTLSSISPSVPSCAAAANKYLNITDPASINKIVGFAKVLFGIQLNHTKNVINFFKTYLFRIDNNFKSIDIHPKLLDGNIKALEEVSKKARELLINYYKSCEEKYQLGVQAVLNSKYVAT